VEKTEKNFDRFQYGLLSLIQIVQNKLKILWAKTNHNILHQNMSRV